MQRIIKSIGLAVFMILLTVQIALAQQVKIEAQTGTPDYAKEDAQTAVAAAERFFQDNMKMTLAHNVRILIVPNSAAYIKAMVSEFKFSQALAEDYAKTSRAGAGTGLILQNAGHESLQIKEERLFNIAHEMVHQYQQQTFGYKDVVTPNWIREGTADVYAVMILDAQGPAALAAYKDKQLALIKATPTHPNVKELSVGNSWRLSVKLHGKDVTYAVSDNGILGLIDGGSYKKMFAFYDKMKTAPNAESGFQEIFGMPLSTYEKQAQQRLTAAVEQ